MPPRPAPLSLLESVVCQVTFFLHKSDAPSIAFLLRFVENPLHEFRRKLNEQGVVLFPSRLMRRQASSGRGNGKHSAAEVCLPRGARARGGSLHEWRAEVTRRTGWAGNALGPQGDSGHTIAPSSSYFHHLIEKTSRHAWLLRSHRCFMTTSGKPPRHRGG
jgi:hypothetical protein